MTWFWLVIFYSFGGYLLEKGYAAAVRSPHRVRKCFLLLPLCPVYGLAMLAAGHLPPSCTEPFWRLVLYGGLTCTAVEYAVHFLYEKLLGVLFWDYSDIPFNLGGRINLLYCFFWGIAAVVWLKKFYPVISRWIEKIPMKFGEIITWILIVFMVANMLVSTLALARYDERAHQKPAANAIEQTIDAHFPDARMEKIYPNAKAIN